MKITAYNQHDVGSSHEPWSCFIAYQSTRDGPTSLCNQAKRRTPFIPAARQAPQGVPASGLVQIPPSKIFFDKYRSAESGIIVATLFPALSRRATSSAANTPAPPLDPASTPSRAASRFTISNASSSVTAITSSHTAGSNVSGMKLFPIPSTLCGPGAPPPRTEPCLVPAPTKTPGTCSFIYLATPVNVPQVPHPTTTASTFPFICSNISTAVVS